MKRYLLFITLFINTSLHTQGTLIEHYALATLPEADSKVLILSASQGPAIIAQQHTIALRTFLNHLMVGRHVVDLITEEIASLAHAAKEPAPYKLYLERTQMGAVKYVAHDYRDRLDADLIAMFAIIAKELHALMHNDYETSKGTWPDKDFFVSNESYRIIKDHIRANIQEVSTHDFLTHLHEQEIILHDREQFPHITPKIMFDLQSRFVTSKQKAIAFINKHAQDQQPLLVDIIFALIENSDSSKSLEQMVNTFTTPSSIVAQAGFLSGILESQKKDNLTIFFAHVHQTKVISDYLKQMGYTFTLSTPLVKAVEQKIASVDIWSFINLLMHSFAESKALEQQCSLLDMLLKNNTKRCSVNLLIAT